MSGIEVVGLVLGIIPLVISALEHYHDGSSAASTWRRHARVIQSLTRNLRTEHGKMYNTCETLLSGIVPATRLEPMLQEPFGPSWRDQETSRRIEERLDHMYSAFEETVKEMNSIIKELKLNLGISTRFEADESTRGPVKLSVMMRASLVIKRSSYEEALQRLITKNQTLETIVIGSLRLEPSRRKRSHGKYLEIFRRVFSSIYKALHLGLCSHCPRRHGVSLQLLTAKPSLKGDAESVIKKLIFRVILSHHAAELTDADPWKWIWKWKEIGLQIDGTPKSMLKQLVHPESAPVQSERQNRTRRVRISEQSLQIIGSSATGSSNTKYINSTLLTTPSEPSPDKLCQILSIGRSIPNICGYVTDPSVQEYGRFGVSCVNESTDNRELSFIPIRDMMEIPACWRQMNNPSLPEKLTVASAIASAILQLYNTPWLSRVMTSHTLYLAKFDSVASFNQVYISKSAPEDHCSHGPKCQASCEGTAPVLTRTEQLGNDLMWALFILLIEVILWRTIDDILTEGNSGKLSANLVRESPSQIFDYTTEKGFSRVRDILSKVTMVGGQDYCGAVECCLKLAYSYPRLSLDHEELRQQILGNIVAPIETSCESSQTLTIIHGGYGITF
ncbi:hypothetical protein F5Y16DRAFT_392755 [Xylariaceae sp. FL0255]|nr:hypothetical protein F5Y16DRAFT_392755 [Xylariaceae sp. FL0255]